MTQIRTFDELERNVKDKRLARIAIVGGADDAVLETAAQAIEKNLISKAVLTGIEDEIVNYLKKYNINKDQFEIRNADNDVEAALIAVKAVRNGEADILMKGKVESKPFFKQVLDSQTGIKASEVLSNISVFEMDSYHKLIGVTDNAIIPNPTLENKIAIINNTRPLYNALGISNIKVAAVAAADKVTKAMQATIDASELKKLSDLNKITGFIIDGPFGYDVSISSKAAKKKNFQDSEVAGDPDLLLFHDLEAANAIGKALKFHGQAKSGGVVLGATVPIMFNSRSDSMERRLNSLILAMAIQKGTVA